MKEGGSMFSDRYRAIDYQNSWPKNYHELSYAWSNEKNYLTIILWNRGKYSATIHRDWEE